jgi:two-component system sensor histidine kinase and response regulator WspE
MNTLWPLFAEEVARSLPKIVAALDTLAIRAHDASARLALQNEVAKLRSAMRVLGEPGLDALLQPLTDPDASATLQRAAIERLAALMQHAPETAPAPASIAPTTRAGSADTSLESLFSAEIDHQSVEITRQLLQLEAAPDRHEPIRPLMRAVHSIKGAARAVGLQSVVDLTHALEDGLAQLASSGASVSSEFVDLALRSLDAIRARSRNASSAVEATLTELRAALISQPPMAAASPAQAGSGSSALAGAGEEDPVLRVRASQISHLIGLASTASVEGHRLDGFAQRQQRLRRLLAGVRRQFDEILQRHAIALRRSHIGTELLALRHRFDLARQELIEGADEFTAFARGAHQLNSRLLHAATGTRLRPFADLATGYPRLVRDLARQLGKQARLKVDGERLDVDRDVLLAIDAPLTHLLRNAIDHGIEAPAVRLASGKPAEGEITIRASYRGGLLMIEVGDDGAGVDPERVRRRLVEGGHLDADLAARLDVEDLHEALFASGFSTRERVTETSGRGIGLDAVRQMVHELDGSVRLASRFGIGTRFELQVPISRAILRALLVEVDGELCAFALTRVGRVVRASPRQLVQDGSLRYLPLDGRNIGLIALSEQLDWGRTRYRETVSVVVFEQYGRPIGCVVDAIVGEADLATRPLDRRLGRVADVASVALTADGAPVVVLDVDDLLRSAFDPRRRAVARALTGDATQQRTKRVLVVDDSISVRELERQLLAAAGYEVEVAIDGEDAWLTLQRADFDLMVTDVDMPRLDGIALTRSVRQEARLRNLPVIIVSYRDRPEDHARGMEVRADRYLTKSDFDDERFIAAVVDLIGEAAEP